MIKYFNFKHIITFILIALILLLYSPNSIYGQQYEDKAALYLQKARDAQALGDVQSAVSWYRDAAIIYEDNGEIKKSAFYWMKVYILGDKEGYWTKEAGDRLKELGLIDSDDYEEAVYADVAEESQCHKEIHFDFREGNDVEVEREDLIEKTLKNIEMELAVDYQRVDGEQSFTMIDSQGARISQLTYPIKGDIITLRGEVKFHPKFSLGVSYGSSNFSETTCSDEDWDFIGVHNGEIKTIEYQITEQGCESEMEILDINLYWNLLDFRHTPERETSNNIFVVDRILLDLFGGFHQQKGRYTMKDPTTQYLRVVDGATWQATGLPLYQGLYSPYKVKYSGPNLGIRFRGEGGKLSTGFSMAYAWIRTTAHGWWNLRSYSFTQKSTHLGHAFMLDADVRYDFYRDWYLGIGYRYMEYFQERLKESGVQLGSTYDDLDIVRDVNNKIYGPYFTLGVIW